MKKYIMIGIAVLASTVFALQCYETTVSNDLPATAASAGVFGYLEVMPKGENMRIVSEMADVSLHTVTSTTGTAAQVALTNMQSYLTDTYTKFATTTAQEYRGIFKPNQRQRLLMTTTLGAATTGGTAVVQKVYIVIY